MKQNNIPLKATGIFLDTWEKINSKKYKLIVQEGSSRSSKTWSDFLVIFNYVNQNSLKSITVLRDTATDCRDVVETEFVKWMKDPCGRTLQLERGEITMQQYTDFIKREDLRQFFNENKTKHVWTSKYTGSYIRFTGLDDDDKVMGLTQSVCWINEPYKFPHEVYRQLAQRTSDFILIDWNPKQSHWIEQEKKRENTYTQHSTFRDNPFCPEESRKQILSYQPISMIRVVMNKQLSEQEVREYDTVENRLSLKKYDIEEIERSRYNESVNTASEFHWSVYGLGIKAERPNRIFKWQKIPLHEYTSLDVPEYYGVDWGAVDPWGIVAVKYYDGALYLRQKNYASENTIREKMTTTEKEQIAGEEEGIVSWMFKKLDVPYNAPIICDNNRTSKIIALREAGWEYAIAAVKPKGSIIDGIDLLNDLKVYYTDDSSDLEYEQENYSRKIDRFGTVLEEPEDNNNHIIDPTRYVAQYLQDEGIICKI